jgi:hypothetical protein
MSVCEAFKKPKVAKVAEGSNKGSSYNPYKYYIILYIYICATFATLFSRARESIYIFFCEKISKKIYIVFLQDEAKKGSKGSKGQKKRSNTHQKQIIAATFFKFSCYLPLPCFVHACLSLILKLI